MRHNSISMLLVGRNLQRCPELYWWLDNRELRCEYAEFCHDACSRISRRQFERRVAFTRGFDRSRVGCSAHHSSTW